ncbi:MAG: Gfo/Idh/MocA family oxidoreductase [Myxococcales bacterium]|nr:Gfo/Idh/MocA family oxidoreductase [Myxococcales bacterium]
MSLRFAIAGYGYIAHYHARAVVAAGGTVTAVLGRDPDKAAAFAQQHGGAAVFTSLDRLLAADVADALVVATPNSLHAPSTIAALRAGLHVLVEKPMALDGTQARQMAAAATAADRQLLVGHMWRYDPQAIAIRDAVQAGEIGQVVKTKGYGIHVAWGPGGWFVDPQLAGGGALVDMGVHAIDTARFLLGDPRPVSVYARLSTRFGSYAVDDLGVIVIEWEGGVTSVIESGWWNPHMDGPEASTQLFGTQGYARLFPNELRRTGDDPNTNRAAQFPPRAEHCAQEIYDAQLEGFVESIRTGVPPLASTDVGTVVMDICDAAYRSAASNEVVLVG